MKIHHAIGTSCPVLEIDTILKRSYTLIFLYVFIKINIHESWVYLYQVIQAFGKQ